jgi:4'-phosphopantetheinyl transferase
MNDKSALAPDVIDIYRIRLDRNEAEVSACSTSLSDEEKQRAAKFLSASKSREFTITRSTLRKILAQTLDCDPSEITIANHADGKPYLQYRQGDTRVRFSVSHSADLAMIAVTLDRDIGIDVEKIRTDIDYQTLARRFFSAAEYEAIQDCSEQIQLQAFFATWTRKEAVVKATGKGIAAGLKLFDVSTDPLHTPVLLATRPPLDELADLTLYNLDSAPDYCASLALSGGPAQICYRTPP